MSESGSSPADAQAIVLPEDETADIGPNKELARRREVTWKLRLRGYTKWDIVAKLTRYGIHTSYGAVTRDIQAASRDIRKRLDARNFDPLEEFMNAVATLEDIRNRSNVRAAKTHDNKEAAILYKVAIDAQVQITDLMQDVGFIDERVSRVIKDADATKDASRIPSGEELQRRIGGMVIKDAELVSDAERAWMYGDATAAAAAAEEAEGKTTGDASA
jgi:hypothetical protein